MTESPIVPRIQGYKHIKIWSQKGGMGNIFKARDVNTQQDVIIKMIKIPETAEEEELLPYYSGLFKFETELALSIKSTDTHVLKALTHGFVLYEGYMYPYLVFPYIQDGSLDRLMETEHPWSNPDWSLFEIVDMIIQVAEGLSVFHHRSPPIVHQDIKPGNLLWKPAKNGARRVHIWISDFGTARWEMQEEYETSPLGTRQYMSPEQANGKVRCTTDQYALAIVARYLLTGSKPTMEPGFAGPSPAQLVNPPPTLLNPLRLHSKEIDRVFSRALAEHPHERYPDVTQFVQELYEAVFHQEYPTAPFIPIYTPDFYNAITDSPLSEKGQTQVQKQLSATIPAHNGQSAYEEIEILPDFLIQRPREIQVVDLPMPPPPVKSGRVEIPYAPLTQFRLQEVFSAKLPATPTTLAWSQPGNHLLCTFLNDAPQIMYRDGHVEEIKALRGHLACWSPDSRYIATSFYNLSSREAILRIWDRANPMGSAIKQSFNTKRAIDGLTWSSRNQLVAWVDSELLLFTVSGQTSLVKFPELTRGIPVPDTQCSAIGTLEWSPDGSLLAGGGDNGVILCWDTNRQRTQEYIPSFKSTIQSLAWSADSSMLAVSYSNRCVVIWDMVRNRERKSWNDLTQLPRMVSLSPHDFTVAIATRNHLLFGNLQDQVLSVGDQGHLLTSWSPLGELATIREHKDTTLIILQKL